MRFRTKERIRFSCRSFICFRISTIFSKVLMFFICIRPSFLRSNVCSDIMITYSVSLSRTFVRILDINGYTIIILLFLERNGLYPGNRPRSRTLFETSALFHSYLYGESNRSVILQCRPWARSSMVSIRGETPLQISDTVDLGKPIAIATCRTDKPYLNI